MAALRRSALLVDVVEMTMRPVTTVESADQRNQNKASGAIYLLTPGFRSAGMVGMIGVCTRLEQYALSNEQQPTLREHT